MAIDHEMSPHSAGLQAGPFQLHGKPQTSRGSPGEALTSTASGLRRHMTQNA